MDDESGSSHRKASKKPKKEIKARSTELAWDEANALVVEIFPKQCRVRFFSDRSEILCSYRRAQVIDKTTRSEDQIRERSPVAVGDRVKAEMTGNDSGIVEGICARKNSLLRPAPGRDDPTLAQVFAANIDAVLIVASVDEPLFSSGMVDRYLVAAGAAQIPAWIAVTKMDLHPPAQAMADLQIYRDLGLSLFEASSKRGVGIDELRTALMGRTVVFCGRSGVGKTSLLRSLLGSDIGKIAEVSQATGKGRHTTTSAILIPGPKKSAADPDSNWIDTPGVREFGLTGVEVEKLSGFFPEFQNLGCEIAGCLHREEPGCSVKTLARYASYRRILESLLAGER